MILIFQPKRLSNMNVQSVRMILWAIGLSKWDLRMKDLQYFMNAWNVNLGINKTTDSIIFLSA